MQTIYFKDDREFIYCCELLFQHNKSLHIAWNRNEQWGNEMNVKAYEITLQTWIHCFVMLYTSFRLGRKIKEMIKQYYYYTDDIEINQIYDSTMTILSERYFTKQIFPENETLYTTLFTIFKLHMKGKNSVHFDAIILFCLKPIEDYLIKAIGFGIDEIKREESYQQFIIKIRESLQERQIIHTELHIMEKNGVFYFHANGIYSTKMKWLSDMSFDSYILNELNVENTFLAPIVALAPEKIYVYSDRPIEGKVYTLYRIFQENMELLESDQFPYS